jgi:hypothetical protein
VYQTYTVWVLALPSDHPSLFPFCCVSGRQTSVDCVPEALDQQTKTWTVSLEGRWEGEVRTFFPHVYARVASAAADAHLPWIQIPLGRSTVFQCCKITIPGVQPALPTLFLVVAVAKYWFSLVGFSVFHIKRITISALDFHRSNCFCFPVDSGYLRYYVSSTIISEMKIYCVHGVTFFTIVMTVNKVKI